MFSDLRVAPVPRRTHQFRSTPVSIKVMSRAPAKGGMRFKYDRPEVKVQRRGRQSSGRLADNKAAPGSSRSGSPIREYAGIPESPRCGSALSPYGNKSTGEVKVKRSANLFDDDDEEEEVLYDGANIDAVDRYSAYAKGAESTEDNKAKERRSETNSTSPSRKGSRMRPKSAVAGGASRFKKPSIIRPSSARRPISSKRRAQLDEVEAVKKAFAKYGLSVGAGVLERCVLSVNSLKEEQNI